MRTNSTSSFGSSIHLEDAVSACSSTANPGTNDAYTRLKTYGKYFTTRLIQILVQSRTNEKHDQKCFGASSGNDWFNVKVDELGEVSAQIKRCVQIFPPEIPCVTIDFFLYTADQEQLPLESWSFSVGNNDFTRSEINKSDLSELYHQLATLLKSAQLACHMTPMHRYYVKKQGPDTFVILYRILMGSTSIELGDDAKIRTIGCFPSPVGPFKLTLSYRTRMEIDRTLAESTCTTTDPQENQENIESFQQVGSFSSANTPESGNCASSPMSIGGISHFSVSPPSAHSPATDPGLRIRQSRSRTCSLASEADSEGLNFSPKERMMTSHSLPSIPKNMPFANLLTLSYTGTLHSVPEEREKSHHEMAKVEVHLEDSSPDSSPPPEEEPEEHEEHDETLLQEENPLEPEVAAVQPELDSSQRTVVDYSMSDTMKPPESGILGEKIESDDEDSFVKIPTFVSNDMDSGLSDFISSCKAAPKIESFSPDSVTALLAQIEEFSSNQGAFDKFISTVRNMVEEGDE